MLFLSGNAGAASSERADCSSLSDAQLDQLAIAVGLVASMDVADRDRPVVLKRVLDFVAQQRIGKGPMAAGE
jgi:DNA-binding IclR family transcriptional regulator